MNKWYPISHLKVIGVKGGPGRGEGGTPCLSDACLLCFSGACLLSLCFPVSNGGPACHLTGKSLIPAYISWCFCNAVLHFCKCPFELIFPMVKCKSANVKIDVTEPFVFLSQIEVRRVIWLENHWFRLIFPDVFATPFCTFANVDLSLFFLW